MPQPLVEPEETENGSDEEEESEEEEGGGDEPSSEPATPAKRCHGSVGHLPSNSGAIAAGVQTEISREKRSSRGLLSPPPLSPFLHVTSAEFEWLSVSPTFISEPCLDTVGRQEAKKISQKFSWSVSAPVQLRPSHINRSVA